MAHERIISNSRGIEGGGLPVISQDLDSVRAYQFEIHFDVAGLSLGAKSEQLTLAAKQVGQMGFASEDIEVHRVNDKVFYPGKTIYDPTTGSMSNGADINVFKAQKVTVLHLDARGKPKYETILYGVYPKSWKTAEFNYGTNEFHTIEMEFRYDFMDHTDSSV